MYNTLCKLIEQTDYMCNLMYCQNYFEGSEAAKNMIKLLSEALSAAEKTEFAANIGSRLPQILNCQENNDYIGMADFYKTVVRPECVALIDKLREDGIWQEITDYYTANYEAADENIRTMLDSINCEVEDVPQGYELIETQTGTFTMQLTTPIDNKKLRLSSAANPYEEARILAGWYDDGKPELVILGFGMGYLPGEFIKHEDICKITVCEHDKYVIKAAFHYMDLSDILKSGKVSILYDPDLKQFSKEITDNENKTVLVHNASMMNIKDARLRESVRNFFLYDSSVRNQGKKLDGNFLMNTTKEALKDVLFADELNNSFKDKNVLFLAAGPSLEENLPYIKECESDYSITVYDKDGVNVVSYDEMGSYSEDDEYIIVCVGTVLRELTNIGIKPDYVVMIDAQDNMINQIKGVDTSELNLIYLPTLYHGVVSAWKGNKYMALQRDYLPSEKMADNNNLMLFETGGSVSTLALDMLIRFLCKRVVCMGLDLAFVDNKRHTGERAVNMSESELRQVKGACGDTVLTSLNLDNYRLWIERRIKKRTDKELAVELINVSRGAYISGMKNGEGL